MFKKKYRICELGDGKFVAERLDLGFFPGRYYVNEFGNLKWYMCRFDSQEEAEAAVLLKLKNDADEAESIRAFEQQNRIVKTIKKLP